ncbi:MAG: hypothetical protein FJ100_21560 [Deltaproteobacteria bacterium]|nr:hypothetical protein [Deltaproteobacteria bacterium]
MFARTVLLVCSLALAACRAAPPAAPGESAHLTRAKQLVEATAGDFEQLAATLHGADDEARRAAGEKLRRALESRRAEGEALAKQLSEEERQKLRQFGVSRLRPAVLAVEKQLGTDKPHAAPADAPTATAG